MVLLPAASAGYFTMFLASRPFLFGNSDAMALLISAPKGREDSMQRKGSRLEWLYQRQSLIFIDGALFGIMQRLTAYYKIDLL